MRATRCRALINKACSQLTPAPTHPPKPQVEEPGGKSYKVSGPDNMLACIANLQAGEGANLEG